MECKNGERQMLDRITVGDGCWEWTGNRRESGYGVWRRVAVHRRVYELLVGSIPEGMDLDHMCHNADTSCLGGSTCPHRRCVNSDHLQPATRRTNLRRGRAGPKTHCKHGHEYTPENTYVRKDGRGRMCKKCTARVVREVMAGRWANDPEYRAAQQRRSHDNYIKRRDKKPV